MGGELMGINGINDYSALWQNYNMPQVKVPALLEPRSEEIQTKDQNVTHENLSVPSIEVSEPSARTADAPLEDISVTFNRQDDFGYIGQDRDIHSLDIEKAISDMKKDGVLKQYQYFVGNRGNLISESEDGVVIAK